jgi:hypothetical protein
LNPQATYGQNDGMAIASLVIAIVSLCPCLTFGGPVAIYLGWSSRNKIENSRGALRGEGLALGGLIIGIIATVELAIWIVFLAVNAVQNNLSH